MIHASLRENDKTIHHIVSDTGIAGIFATAGLLAEAINYRNGYSSGRGQWFSLTVILEGFDGVFSKDEYTIRACGEISIGDIQHGLLYTKDGSTPRMWTAEDYHKRA